MNHLGDTNKMVSDTPRTDAACNIYDLQIVAEDIERELNTANERIKELEAKVDELNDLKKWLEGR
jgi:hypothetical protein